MNVKNNSNRMVAIGTCLGAIGMLIIMSLLPDGQVYFTVEKTPAITACEIESNGQLHVMPCHAINESTARADI